MISENWPISYDAKYSKLPFDLHVPFLDRKIHQQNSSPKSLYPFLIVALLLPLSSVSSPPSLHPSLTRHRPIDQLIKSIFYLQIPSQIRLLATITPSVPHSIVVGRSIREEVSSQQSGKRYSAISSQQSGSGWGGFDGWGRRRNKRILGFLVILLVSGLGLWFILGKRSDSVLFSGSFGLVLLGLSVDGWRRGLKDWALGFCCCAFLVSLALKKEDFQKLVGSVLKMKDSQKWAKSFAAMQCGRRRK